MRIVMMGTGPFAVPTFRSLIESPHEISLLVTRPPRMGRGKKTPPPNPMQMVAQELGIPVEMPDSINTPEASEMLQRLAADLFVVCDYGQILSSASLGIARLGGINLHASLLPRYRGAAPIHWAVYDGETETGVTVIHMTRRLDAGPNLVQERVTIGPGETAIALEERLALLGVQAIHKAIGKLAEWDGTTEIGERQNSESATKAPRLKRQDGQVDWSRSAIQIANQVRAFQPWPGTFSHWLRTDDEPLRVILDDVIAVRPIDESPREPGVVVETENRLSIATGDGLLQVNSIQPSGRNRQPWDAFLRGYRVANGDRFGSPLSPSSGTSDSQCKTP